MTLSMDTQLQNFWIESINKEASLRFAWHLKYSKEFAKTAAAKQQQEKAGATGGNSMHGKPRLTFNKNNSVSERIKKLEANKKRATSAPLSESADGKEKLPDIKESRSRAASAKSSGGDMRPPSGNTRTLLYSGISAHGEGRYAYLKKRKLLTPEEKFNFPILSSCQYGWKILEYSNPKPSAYARTCVIKDSFYRNSGIMFG